MSKNNILSIKNINKTKLYEIGDKPYQYKIDRKELEHFSASFRTESDVHIEFDAIFFQDNNYWDIAWTADGDLGLTGKGDQYFILSTILKIVERFMLTYNPDEFRFTADKNIDQSTKERKTTRTKIYKKGLDILAKKYDYTVIVVPLTYLDKFVVKKNKKLTEEINTKELSDNLYKRIIKNAEKIHAADTPGKIMSVIRNIATRHSYQMSKKHKPDIEQSDWIYDIKLTNKPNHSGAIAFNQFGMGLLNLEISKPLINQYLKLKQIPEKKDEAFTVFWNTITRMLSHEFLHLEQWLRSKGQQANRKTMLGKLKTDNGIIKTDTTEEFKHYLSDKLEISAYAYNAVQELVHNNIDIHKLYNQQYLSKSGIAGYLASKSSSFNNYYQNFGRNKNNIKDQKVWELFLKKFTFHLELRVKS